MTVWSRAHGGHSINSAKVAALAALALLNAAAFAPSLGHLPRADQLWFLLDTLRADRLADLFAGFYSWPRVRLYAPGDELHFRPLFFMLLGFEKWAFGTRFAAQQFLGLMLHGLVVAVFLKLLSTAVRHGAGKPGRRSSGADADPPWPAIAAAFFFSPLALAQDMVVWTHIHGNMLFLAVSLGAADQLLVHLADGGEDALRRSAAFSAAACFLYEPGLVFAAVYAAVLWRSGAASRRRGAAYFLLPVLAWGALNALDYAARSQPAERERNRALVSLTLHGAGKGAALSVETAALWLLGGLFPAVFKVQPGPRFGLSPADYWARLGSPGFEVFLNAACVAALAVCAARLFSRRAAAERRVPLQLFAGLFLGYLGLLMAGRGVERGLSYLFGLSTYHAYVPWCLLLLMACAAVEPDRWRRLPARWRLAGLAAAAGLVGLNAAAVFRTGRDYASRLAPTRAYLLRIQAFVSRHRHEPDFSFRIMNQPPEDEICVMLRADGKEFWYLSDVLFGRYTRAERPKYVLDGGGSPRGNGAPPRSTSRDGALAAPASLLASPRGEGA